MTKDKLLEAIHELPQVFDLEALIEKLILIEKIEKGIKQLENGEAKIHEEVKKTIDSWTN